MTQRVQSINEGTCAGCGQLAKPRPDDGIKRITLNHRARPHIDLCYGCWVDICRAMPSTRRIDGEEEWNVVEDVVCMPSGPMGIATAQEIGFAVNFERSQAAHVAWEIALRPYYRRAAEKLLDEGNPFYQKFLTEFTEKVRSH